MPPQSWLWPNEAHCHQEWCQAHCQKYLSHHGWNMSYTTGKYLTPRGNIFHTTGKYLSHHREISLTPQVKYVSHHGGNISHTTGGNLSHHGGIIAGLVISFLDTQNTIQSNVVFSLPGLQPWPKLGHPLAELPKVKKNSTTTTLSLKNQHKKNEVKRETCGGEIP